jgi:adenine-specific DNA-methyltransferase
VIRSELDVLLDKVDNEALRADLRTQIDRLKQKRSFGLVFERHIPERVRLPQHPIRVGSLVVSRDDDDSPTYEVLAIADRAATIKRVRDPDGAYLPAPEHRGETEQAPLDSLVVITDFGEPVLPGLRHVGSVERGGDKPYHVVINGENHHALEALRFTHAGKVDCIYIDPPYNTGARDWKYDNDYVDDTDAYRHSKWLAFMERRLKLAKDLLNPEDSVLIVTIDEKEYQRLGLLLGQVFPGMPTQMITIVTNPNGVARGRELARVEEYAFFVFMGSAGPAPVPDSLLGSSDERTLATEVRWERLMRGGSNSRRQDRPNLFFPVYVDPESRRIVDAGEALPLRTSRTTVPERPGLVAIWPVRSSGEEANWRTSPEYLRELMRRGYARVGPVDAATHRYSLGYLGKAQIRRIETGDIRIVGKRADGSVVLESERELSRRTAKTVWNRPSHKAGEYGSSLLKRFVPNRAFPFPKSLYAVEDALRIAVGDMPNAVLLDFFAGSGTTAHAVMRLNKQDGGLRQSIMVTNNEVSADEANELRAGGLRPGDADWETLGIFEHITRPRVTAAITGLTPEGQPIKGDYRFTDEFPMADGFDENVAFLELRYLDADDVDLGLAYDDLAPLLWLRAGAQGRIARRVADDGAPLAFDWTDRYGVLFDEDQWRAFVAARPESAIAAFIATWSPATFAGIAAELPAGMDVVRLYDTYLSQFLPDRVGA